MEGLCGLYMVCCQNYDPITTRAPIVKVPKKWPHNFENRTCIAIKLGSYPTIFETKPALGNASI